MTFADLLVLGEQDLLPRREILRLGVVGMHEVDADRPLRRRQGGRSGSGSWPESAAATQIRHALNLRARITGSVPGEREVRDRLFAFYDWCAQNDDIPELPSLARTISRWEDQIVCAVLTGVTNAAAESLNRLAKLEARLAYGFRNPASQRRRVRIACTRDSRRPSHTEISRRTHSVTEWKPVPG